MKKLFIIGLSLIALSIGATTWASAPKVSDKEAAEITPTKAALAEVLHSLLALTCQPRPPLPIQAKKGPCTSRLADKIKKDRAFNKRFGEPDTSLDDAPDSPKVPSYMSVNQTMLESLVALPSKTGPQSDTENRPKLFILPKRTRRTHSEPLSGIFSAPNSSSAVK